MKAAPRLRICCQVREIGRTRLGEQEQHVVRLQARWISPSTAMLDGVVGDLVMTLSDADAIEQFELGTEIYLDRSEPEIMFVTLDEVGERGVREIRLLLPADATQAEIDSAVAGLSRV